MKVEWVKGFAEVSNCNKNDERGKYTGQKHYNGQRNRVCRTSGNKADSG